MEGSSHQRDKLSVLIVDDDDIHRYALVRALEQTGFRVFSARTGTEALALTKDQKPHVLLLDINLPDVNGFEICARLKTNPETEAIPVIFHSATTAPAAAQSYAQSLGATAFMTYPMDTDQLAVVLKGAIARADRRNEK